MKVAVVVALFLVQGGAGEGEGEGEVDPCAPVCVGATHLAFCADGAPTTLDCALVAADARCAVLSAEWGADCALPAGAACDPDYAFGRSRCAEGLACRDDVCAPGEPTSPAPPEPTDGTVIDLGTTTTASPFGCAGSAPWTVSPTAGLLGALALLRRHGRRRGAPADVCSSVDSGPHSR